MRKVIVKRFPTLLEAKLAESCLEAAGIAALVDNETHGSMIPHYSDALGGFSVSVDEENSVSAHELLSETAKPDPQEASLFRSETVAPEQEALRLLRRAVYGALLSIPLLPGLGSAGALYLYVRAYKKDPAVLGKHPLLAAFGLLFALSGFAIIAAVALIYLNVNGDGPLWVRH